MPKSFHESSSSIIKKKKNPEHFDTKLDTWIKSPPQPIKQKIKILEPEKTTYCNTL